MTEIITRAQWGARFADGFGTRQVGSLDKWLHHSVTAAPPVGADLAADVAAMHVLEGEGQSRFGGGISYSFVIPPSGRVFEGISIGRIGAHTYRRNSGSVGIVLVGNYMTQTVSGQQKTALAGLLQHGVAQGWWRIPTLTGGHRDVYPTACPGTNAYADIPAINALAGGRAVATSAPVSAPAPVPAKPVDARPRNADGSLTLPVDGNQGGATNARWQEVMGTPIDGVLSKPSGVVRADQTFLNASIDVPTMTNLIGKARLDVDGITGAKTDKARQFLLRNWVNPQHQQNLIGKLLDFDGIWGAQSVRVFQFALNNTRAGSKTYGHV